MSDDSVSLQNRFSPPQPYGGTLQPGESRKFDMPGVYARIQECNGTLSISFDLGQPFPTTVGLGYRCLPGDEFKQITLTNDSASPVTFTILIGRMVIDDARLNILTASNYLPMTEPVTKLVGQGITNLAAAASVVLNGTPGAGQYRRAAVIIDNLDAAAALTILDQAGQVAGYVLPSTSRYLAVSGYVEIKNETIGAVNCGIGEIWELNP
jgi:hypothetical protein